jgi:transposase
MSGCTHPAGRIGVGIDTARYGHHVTFLGDELQPIAPDLAVPESRPGYQGLERQLRRLRDEHPEAAIHVRLDAAGQYASNLERFLRSLDLPLALSVGEPKRNKDYHHAHSPKRQTDSTESWAMARYAVVERPAPSRGAPPEHAALRRVASRLQAQTRHSTRLVNQLHETLSAAFPELAKLVRDLKKQWVLRLLQQYPTAQRIAAAHLETLQRLPHVKPDQAAQIHAAARSSVASLRGAVAEALVRQLVRELQDSLAAEERWKELLVEAFAGLPDGPHRQIKTITGIGEVTAAAIVATAVDISRFPTPADFVGYYGVFPMECSSGFDKFGRPNPPGKKVMCPKGNDLVRGLLWNCAKSAAAFNPAVRSLYKRLTQRSERRVREDVAFGYCMTKLLQLVYAVWKTGKPFDAQHHPWEPSLQEEEFDHTTHAAPISNTPAAPINVQPAATASVTPDQSSTNPQLSHDSFPEKKAAGRKEPNSIECGSQEKAVTAAGFSITGNGTPDKPIQRAPSRYVDFAYVRSQVTMEQVLRHLGVFARLRHSGKDPHQYRGPCPIHGADDPKRRSFSVNLQKQAFQCFHPPCRAQGDVLDFWAAYHGLTLHEAGLHLADTFGISPSPPLNSKGPPHHRALHRKG